MEPAASHLKKLGHRKIGYLSSALGPYVYRARHAAFYAPSSQIEHTPISTILLHAELVERGSAGPVP